MVGGRAEGENGDEADMAPLRARVRISAHILFLLLLTKTSHCFHFVFCFQNFVKQLLLFSLFPMQNFENREQS